LTADRVANRDWQPDKQASDATLSSFDIHAIVAVAICTVAAASRQQQPSPISTDITDKFTMAYLIGFECIVVYTNVNEVLVETTCCGKLFKSSIILYRKRKYTFVDTEGTFI